MTRSDQPPGRAESDLPVLTEVAVPGDAARERGLYFEAKEPVPTEADGPDAEAYLADRLKSAVHESLSEAMVRAARSVGRNRSQTTDTDGNSRR